MAHLLTNVANHVWRDQFQQTTDHPQGKHSVQCPDTQPQETLHLKSPSKKSPFADKTIYKKLELKFIAYDADQVKLISP